jgi:hypothetical protein
VGLPPQEWVSLQDERKNDNGGASPQANLLRKELHTWGENTYLYAGFSQDASNAWTKGKSDEHN